MKLFVGKTLVVIIVITLAPLGRGKGEGGLLFSVFALTPALSLKGEGDIIYYELPFSANTQVSLLPPP